MFLCRTRLGFVVFMVACVATLANAQGRREDYERAEKFLPDQIRHLAYDGHVDPQWIDRTNRFWYRKEGPFGKIFVLADVAAQTAAPAFDHERLAAALSGALKQQVGARALPFDVIRLSDSEQTVQFEANGAAWTCRLAAYTCARSEEAFNDGGARPGAPPGNRLPRTEVPSPDGKFVAFVREHNVWVRVRESGEQFPLTHDGERHYDYASPLPSPLLMMAQGTEEVVQTPAVYWSPDSTRIATYVMDQRNFPRLTMTQSAPPDQFRPKYYSYAYPLPVDFDLPTAKLVTFDVPRRRTITVWARPLNQLYYGGPALEWSADSRRFTYREIERGYKHVRLMSVDAASGVSRTIVEEKGVPLVDTSILLTRSFDGGRSVIWSAERDGWSHLYLYDAEKGALVNQITKGEWVVRSIDYVDEAARVVYFSAGGREPGRDPYLRHTYRIGLDGSGLTLLTQEDADHTVSFAPDGRHFVDAYSRVDAPTISVIRRSDDGRVVKELERAEYAQLTAMGWRFPEPFKAKAADGKTDLYGLIWRPSNFDPKKKYPVIENIYTGPQAAYVPKTFAAFRHQQQAIAELGFITVFVDGRGTALRSLAFRAPTYYNLGQGSGGDDHIAVFKQMAAKYPSMDLSRVGVWGHSAGGYDSTHAILTHPEFYKVAVSSAGCHDNRMDKATWNEQWMGWPVDKHYEEQSNYTLAPNLQGKLFLAHGDVDENVPLPATIKLVDALVQANKDFDFLIMPNRAHGFGNDPYFVRRRWDYFVKHLMGVDPPGGFKIGAPRPTTTTAG